MDRNESATRITMGSVADKMHADVFERTHAAHLERNVNFEVAFASEAESTAIDHLLQHYRKKSFRRIFVSPCGDHRPVDCAARR